MRDIALENDFAYEEYKVTTEDGYILSLMRIPGSLSEMKNRTANDTAKPVIFMQTGLGGDAAAFLINLPN